LGGQTEIDLFKGSATFIKIYAKEVSRGLRKGCINLVIYARPSLVSYCDSLSGLVVNSEDIEPLVIEGVVVRAKKKKDYELD
jgi:hypothetical protein